MKVLLVITKADIGGAQVFILNLVRGLKLAGIPVAVAAGDGSFLPEELKKENIPFFNLKNLNRSKNPLALLLFIVELKKLIDREGFDIVHLNSTNTLPGVMAAKFSKHPPKTIFTVHGLSVLDVQYREFKLIKSVFKVFFKFFLNYVQKVVFVSQYNLVEAIRQGVVTDGSVIYNGLSIGSDYFLERNTARQELCKFMDKNYEGAYLIGSVGRLAPQKNYDFLIKNWTEIKKIKPQAKLIIIGEGPDRKKYEAQLKKANLSGDIFLPGEMKNASRLLKGLNLFILPSVYEGLSISLIEAVLAEIAVLASDVGGNKEIIGADNCFPLDNEAGFLEKLEQGASLQADKSLFAAPRMVKEYIDIYK